MADKDHDHTEPSLELPSFGRRRKARKQSAAADDTVVQPAVPEPVAPELAETQVQPVAAPEPEPAPEPSRKAAKAPKPPKPPREPRGPLVTGYPAALLTGAVVGLVGVGLTSASFRLCEVVQGTSSCGDPGILLLVAILVVMVIVGRLLLRLFASPDPGSTSFLAVGLLTVLSLLFLVDALFDWWMIIAIPVLGMATFALSHWVTTAFIEPAED